MMYPQRTTQPRREYHRTSPPMPQRLLNYMRSNNIDAMTPEQIATAVDVLACSVKQRLLWVLAKGEVVKVGHGKGCFYRLASAPAHALPDGWKAPFTKPLPDDSDAPLVPTTPRTLEQQRAGQRESYQRAMAFATAVRQRREDLHQLSTGRTL